MKMKHLACAVALSVGTAGYANADTATLRIGIEAAYPPFESKTAAGQLQGFDIDIGNAVCVKMQVKCVWVENVFDGLLPALQARKFDLVNSAMNITGKREQIVDFTQAIYVVPMVLVARKNSGLLPTPDSLKGKRIGVLQGAVQDDFVKRNWKPHGVEVAEYSDQNQVYADLAAGRLDGSVQEHQTAQEGFLDKPQGRDYAIVGPPLQDPVTLGKGVGWAFRKQDAALRNRVSNALAQLKADGTLSKLSIQYFNRDIITK
ncbi:ABC transporter substrate-binding protein [Burkholderia cenocepacia]|uniref:transporter substrate-binding domain-containing protein n=1 Tax=Burkholderia cenocepacia TaxID=95486 RepID=UPI000F5B4273|nr:transporter substrate-binding domain-containing protein [Burkholderia cenocepacia]RQT95204.1 ABC transporter substrate-binding protein [Burkholderia cenocepacia]RQU51359.1 ABC transporter substrate-binding protein [Burkholderia cenocepacia]